MLNHSIKDMFYVNINLASGSVAQGSNTGPTL